MCEGNMGFGFMSKREWGKEGCADTDNLNMWRMQRKLVLNWVFLESSKKSASYSVR